MKRVTTSVGCIGRRVLPSRAIAAARRALRGRAHPADALLGDLDGVERPPEHVEREGADLAEHVFCTYQIGVIVDEEQAAVLAAGLLVGHGGEDDVARQLLAAPGDEGQDTGAHRRHVLHVDRAAAPKVAVVDFAGERAVLPPRRVGLDHVDVRVQEQRRLLPGAGDARDHARAALLARDERRLDLGRAEEIGERLGGGLLVAVVVAAGAAVDGGDADDLRKELHARVAFGLPVEVGHHSIRIWMPAPTPKSRVPSS
jgi:hypothetical protein